MTDMSAIDNDLQQQNILIGQLLQAISNQTANVQVYTAAGLPPTASAGTLAYASNGRNPGEGGGAGTGCLVCSNGVIWRAVWSGVLVTV